jgi:hypothetical protein
MIFFRFTVAFCLLLSASCSSMQFGPPHPRKDALEFLQLKGYPAPLINKIMSGSQISESEFYQFGNSENENVRYMIASNPFTPLSLLTILATDSDALVRQGVAHNRSITKEIIDLLKQDIKVQDALVQNSSVPDDVILKIYDGKKVSLAAFANNPNCPMAIQNEIINSGSSLAKKKLESIDYLKKTEVFVQDKDGRWYRQRKQEH